MSTKTKTEQSTSGAYNNTNAYNYMAPPETSDVKALRDYKFTADPSIAYNTAAAKKQFNASLDSPFSAGYNPAIKAAIQRSGNADINMRGAEQASEANQGLQTQNYAQKLQVAGMTAPQLVNTGSSGTSNSSGSGTQTVTPSMGASLAQGASDVGSSLIMAF